MIILFSGLKSVVLGLRVMPNASRQMQKLCN